MDDISTGAPAPGAPSVRDNILARQRQQRDQFFADAAPGTPEADETFERNSTETTTSLLGRGFRSGTAIYAAYRYVSEEWGQQDDPNFKASDHFEELTQGIPVQYHGSVMAAGSMAEAQRIRNRVQEDLKDQSILAREGGAGLIAMLGGSIFDVDAPLVLFSGGAYTAAKTARLTRMALGAREGIKAGFVVGATDAYFRETSDWMDVPAAALTAMSFGAGVGLGADIALRNTSLKARGEFIDRVANDPNLGRTPDYTAADYTPRQTTAAGVTDDVAAFAPVARFIESSGNYAAQNPNSTAFGAYQFIEGTWADVRRANPDLKLPEDIRMATDAQQDAAFQAFTRENAATLEGAGIEVNNSTLYAAHFLGAGGAKKLYRASPDAPITDVMSAEAIAANKGFVSPTDTVGSFQAKIDAKVEKAANSSGAPTGPAEAVGATRNADRPSLAGENISDRSMDWIDAGRNFREDTGWLDAKKAERDSENWYSRHFMNVLDKASDYNLPIGDFHALYKSESGVANFVAGAILESPLGLARGRQTAAMRQEAYNARIMTRVSEPYVVQMQAWAQSNGQAMLGGKYAPESARKEFNKLVQLELNRRRLTGQASPDGDPSVARAADAIEGAADEAFGILKGREGERSVDGFENVEQKRGYSPQVWSAPAIQRLVRSSPGNRAKVVNALALGYVRAGVDEGIATKVANSVINRSINKADGFDMSLANLLTRDGREVLVESLVKDGVDIGEANKIADRLRAPVEERSKEGFTKKRTELDLAVPIHGIEGEPNLQLVDLLDNDMLAVWSRYSRRAAGSAALARAGITNRASRYDLIEALQKEQAALGETPMSTQFLEDVFSHFDGGPIAGGVSPAVAAVKRATNLAYLGMLGATQLGELGAQIGVVGVKNWVARTPEIAKVFRTLKQEAADGTQGGVLDELSVFLGDIGKEHNLFRDDLAVDEMRLPDRDQPALIRHLQKGLAAGQRMQGFVSAFYHVRAAQQRMAVATMADKAVKEIASDGGVSFQKRLRDIGLQQKDVDHIKAKLDEGVIEFSENGRTVNRLNLDQWDPEIAENFALALNRHQNQVVQKAMAGETNGWMHRDTGSLLTHLISFPLLAIQKQTGRQARLMDPQALASLGLTFATAVLAYQVRNAASGDIDRMDDWGEMAKYGFSMGNMTGFIPMFTDPLATMAGLEDYRFNQYGPHTQKSIPALDWANDAIRVPGALKDYAIGEDNGFDRQAVKALPFANTFAARLAFD